MGTQYMGLTTPIGWSTSEVHGTQPWSSTGWFRNYKITVDPAIPNGETLVFTVLKNGLPTLLTATLTAGQTVARDIANVLAVAPGDTLAQRLVRTGGSVPLALSIQPSIEFVSQGGISGYAFQCLHRPSVDVESFASILGYTSADTAWNLEEVMARQIVSCAGTLTRYSVSLDVAAGSGSYIFALLKNGVLQDGSGSTSNTTITLTGSTLQGVATFALAVVPGDHLVLRCTPDSPDASARCGVSASFTAAVLGESMIAAAAEGTGPFTEDTAQYARPQANKFLNIREEDARVWGGVNSWTLSRVRAELLQAISRDLTHTFRKNEETPALPIRFTIPAGSLAGEDLTHTQVLSDDTRYSVQVSLF